MTKNLQILIVVNNCQSSLLKLFQKISITLILAVSGAEKVKNILILKFTASKQVRIEI